MGTRRDAACRSRRFAAKVSAAAEVWRKFRRVVKCIGHSGNTILQRVYRTDIWAREAIDVKLSLLWRTCLKMRHMSEGRVMIVVVRHGPTSARHRQTQPKAR